MELQRIVIVGSGNLAEALARAVAASPLELVQLCARNAERAREISRLAGCPFTADFTRPAAADLYVIAVSDGAVGEVAAGLRVPEGAVVVHTAGSVPVEALPFARRGVFYPFQTFTRGRAVDFAHIPLLLEASDPATFGALRAAAAKLSGCVLEADSALRREVHLAGVFACNFANHAFELGARVLRRAGLDYGLLRPLIAETAAKALDAARPADVQTGPAVRGDRTTQARHVAMLAGEGRLDELYMLMSQSIWETSRRTS